MMNTEENINLEDMRAAWREWNLPEPEHVSTAGKIGMLDRRGRLMRQQNVFTVLCVIWAVLSVPFMVRGTLGTGMPWWVGLYMSIFFAVMGVLSMLQHDAYKSIDMCRMSVRRCMGAVLKAKQFRMRSKMIGVALATPLLGYMLWFFYQENQYAFSGALCGVVLGSMIGTAVDLRMRRHLRWMSEYLDGLEGVSDGEVEGK